MDMKSELIIPTVQFGNIKVEVEGTIEEIVNMYFKLWRKVEEKKEEELKIKQPF